MKFFLDIAFGSNKINIEKKCKTILGRKITKTILENTGPKNLYVCNNKEDSLSLSIKAYNKLLKKNRNLKFDNLIYVTENNVRKYPGNSFLFASLCNLDENINLIDVNSGCTGFVDALKIADKLDKNSLIVCSETYSKNIKNFERNISTLFSDAASVFLYDKKKFKILKSLNIYKKNTYQLLSTKNNKLEMDGGKVFNFVRTVVRPSLTNYLKNIKSPIKTIFLHQASKVVLKYFDSYYSNKYHLPKNIEKRGNSVSATIPVLIYDNYKDFKNTVILCGFGVGLSLSIVTLKIKK